MNNEPIRLLASEAAYVRRLVGLGACPFAGGVVDLDGTRLVVVDFRTEDNRAGELEWLALVSREANRWRVASEKPENKKAVDSLGWR